MSSTAVKRIDHENKIYKIVVFHTNKNAEIYDFEKAEDAELFYEQIRYTVDKRIEIAD